MAYSATPSTTATAPPPNTYRVGNDVYNAGTGAKLTGTQTMGLQQAAYAPIIKGEQQIQDAAIDTQQQADTMALNRQAAANTNQLAMQQGQRRVVGGGLFQPRNINANSAIAGLSSANAKAVADQKKKQVATTLATPQGMYGAIAKLSSARSAAGALP